MKQSLVVLSALTLLSCASVADSTGAKASRRARPLVIAHRGASGYLPEHTIEAYAKAIEMGADFIEPDLVSTKDGVLIARHENEISGTTDVATKFPRRKAKKTIDGAKVEGWFTEDFTYAEIRSLRANERLESRDQSSNGKFLVPTFEEVVALAKRESKLRGRTIGVYPETKHPTYFRSIGLPLEERLVKVLDANGWTDKEAPVFVQSFEYSNLKALRAMTGVRLVFLLESPDSRPYDFVVARDPRRYVDFVSPAGLRDLATFVDGIGPNKRYIRPENPLTKKLLAPTRLVEQAHAAGLVVHPWTFRSDKPFLHASYGGDPAKEYKEFYDLGVDGVFSDFSDHAVRARE